MSIKDLPLAAKTTIDGFMEGFNKSSIKGEGMEFSQYRSYQPGDDLRSLDWKMFARSDRYYIRESEIETSIQVRFLVDASNSMNHKDGAISKIEYARYLAASLGWLAQKQGDAIGLDILQDGKLYTLPAKRDAQHLPRFLYQLEQIKAAGVFTDPISYKEIFSGVHRRALLICITDFYQQDNEILNLLQSLSSLQHEVLVFQLVSDNELQGNFKGYQRLKDLETGQILPITGSLQAAYQQQRTDYQEKIKKELLNRKIRLHQLNIQTPLDGALRDYLNQRNKSAR
ncbi:MAG: DUF58 domain-containing protein [Bacteroidetes bacterium 24-39-8]|nr:MAG: DUF58 domain-containing protein [Sphingobacteriia bacterium 35-40-5]OYZ50251.1 MAG: DUF58 domain-containing protein [Bacteroidetes bacterium 24-39-8]OZA67865.1 MAG: DUF58 domain-containing protein [Sphingobacteriia bacterium 39-39-8]